MSLIKDGGERIEGTGSTGNTGATTIQGVFELYNQQSIAFAAKLVDFPEISNTVILDWNTVAKSATGDGIKEPKKFSTRLENFLVFPKK